MDKDYQNLCPYCGSQMEKGTLHGRGGVGLFWLPEGTPVPYWSFSRKKVRALNGLNLSFVEYFATSSIVAYVCRDCGKAIHEIDMANA